jgi:hypothetical protein
MNIDESKRVIARTLSAVGFVIIGFGFGWEAGVGLYLVWCAYWVET